MVRTGSNPVIATNADVTSSVFETVICNGVANVGSNPINGTNGLIAQLDRAFAYEAKGCKFESY